MSNTYIQGSQEFVAVQITKNNQPVDVSEISLAVEPLGVVPTDFTPASSLGSLTGFALSGTEAVGTYTVWAKIAATGETPLKILGSFMVISGV